MTGFEKLDDKSVLITGAADGIGRALARAFAAGGARVFLTDIAAEKLEKCATELGASSAPCDITEAEAVEDVVSRAWSAIGPIDLLCANAGVFKPGSLLDASQADIHWQFGVNVWGVLNATRPFVRKLRESGRPGHVLMTGSEHSLSTPGYLRAVPIQIYNMTKHSVLSMADGLRVELEPEGIGVSVLCPGPVESGLSQNSGAFRPNRFGGPTRIELDASALSPEAAQRIASLYMPAEEAASIAIDGLARGLFVIPTHPFIQEDADARHRDISRGFESLEDSRTY